MPRSAILRDPDPETKPTITTRDEHDAGSIVANHIGGIAKAGADKKKLAIGFFAAQRDALIEGTIWTGPKVPKWWLDEWGGAAGIMEQIGSRRIGSRS